MKRAPEKCLQWACFFVKVEVKYSCEKAKIINSYQPRNGIKRIIFMGCNAYLNQKMD